DAGDDGVGKPAFRTDDLLGDLFADDLLQLAHHHGVRVRSRRAADAVIGGAHVRDPIADRLVHGILERARTGVYAAHLRTEQLHADDVRALPADVLGAHLYDALEAEQVSNGGSC